MEQYTHIVFHTGGGICNGFASIAELEKIIEPIGVLIFCDQRIEGEDFPQVGMEDVYAKEEEKLPPKNVLGGSIAARLTKPYTEDTVHNLATSLVKVTCARWLDKYNRKRFEMSRERAGSTKLSRTQRRNRNIARMREFALQEDKSILLISCHLDIE